MWKKENLYAVLCPIDDMAGWVGAQMGGGHTDVVEGAVMTVGEVYTCASPSLYKCEVEYKLYKS